MEKRDSFSDWFVWILYPFILAFPVQFLNGLIFRSLYEQMSRGQEILMFIVAMLGLIFFFIRPLAHSLRDARNK